MINILGWVIVGLSSMAGGWAIVGLSSMAGVGWAIVTFRTTDPTPSPSLLETLCRCIVDHQTLPVVRSLFPSGQFLSQPESSSTLLYVKTPLPYPQHFTCQQTPLNTCILPSISDYGHTWSRYHMFSFPCHMFVYYSTCYFSSVHMLFLNLPHARCPLLPIMFHSFSI